MKIVLVGSSGNLGQELLKELINQKHEVVACDKKENEIEELKGKYKFVKINAKKSDTLKGVCDGADMLISAFGLTEASVDYDNYGIDYRGNHNLLVEASVAKVKKFIFVSFITCDQDKSYSVAILNAKNSFEKDLNRCTDLKHIIYRPTAFTNDVVRDMNKCINEGKVELLKDANKYKVNPVDPRDLSKYIVAHLDDENGTVEIGGKETYNYEELAKMCIEASGKNCPIKYKSALAFNLENKLPKAQHEGMVDVNNFIQWSMCHNLVGNVEIGEHSIKELLNK